MKRKTVNEVIIGTRASPLALWQATYIRDCLIANTPSLQVTLKKISTEGDRFLEGPLYKRGGKGLFVTEIEKSLQDGEIDLAVHSMKDVPAQLGAGLMLGAIPKRGPIEDALVFAEGKSVDELKHLRVGTSSLRRRVLLRDRFPNWQELPMRGNVGTRLEKLDRGECDLLVLAAAGLHRLGLAHRISKQLSSEQWVPAAGQGALAVECREDDAQTLALLRPLHDRQTEIAVRAERAVVARLDGGCHLPIAAHASICDAKLAVRGMVGNPETGAMLRAAIEGGATDDPAQLGAAVALELIAQGAEALIRQFDKIDHGAK